jgi:tetratricopeptide (TPR) repeat protein
MALFTAAVPAPCKVIDAAPLVRIDPRPCLPALDEGRFLRSTGTAWVAHFAHGYSCLGAGQFRLAAIEFSLARGLEPNDVRSVMFEAVARDRLGDSAQLRALVALARRTARRASPPMEPLTIPGATELLRGHDAAAFARWGSFADQPYNRPIYEDAHAIAPFREGLARAARGDYCGAVTVLAPVVASNPEFGDVRFVMGAAYYALGMHREARYEWDGAAIATPAQPGFWEASPIQWTALNLLVTAPRE